MRKEPERREKIEHCVEPTTPPRRHRAHVAAGVAEILPRSALAGDFEELLGVVESIDVVPGFRKQMRVATLPARHIQNARADGKT
jgi:hypothetical protein